MIFISHASADDAFVAELRQKLEALQISVWVDSRNLRGGNKLVPEIEKAIEEAAHVLVVLSPSTVNSPWVRREIKKALEVAETRQADGYRVIPILLPGIHPGALGTWFDEEPVGVKIEVGPGGLSAALPAILAALGVRSSTDHQPFEEPTAKPVEELVLEAAEVGEEPAGNAKVVAVGAYPGGLLPPLAGLSGGLGVGLGLTPQALCCRPFGAGFRGGTRAGRRRAEERSTRSDPSSRSSCQDDLASEPTAAAGRSRPPRSPRSAQKPRGSQPGLRAFAPAGARRRPSPEGAAG